MLKRLVIIEPIKYRVVFLLIEFHLDCLKWFNVKDIVTIVKRRLLIVKRWESHTLEVTSVSLLTSHHDPHRAPLSSVDWLDNLWDLIDECDCSRDMVKGFHVSNLLPRHGHVLE